MARIVSLSRYPLHHLSLLSGFEKKVQTFSFFCRFEKISLLHFFCYVGLYTAQQDSLKPSLPTCSPRAPSLPGRSSRSLNSLIRNPQNLNPLIRSPRILKSSPTPCRLAPGTPSPNLQTLIPPASGLLTFPSLQKQIEGRMELHRNDLPPLLFSSPSPSTSPPSSFQLPPAPSMAPSSA